MKHSMKTKFATASITAALLLGSISVLPVSSAYAASSAEVIWGVNMRTSPSTSASIIRMLKKGEEVSITEAGNNWYKITDSNGRSGYISSSSKYTEAVASKNAVSSSDNSTVANTVIAAVSSNAVVKRGVSFREGASTSADRIRYLKTGEQVTVLSKANSYWYLVKDSNGVTGYVTTSTTYLNVTGSISGSGNASSGSSGSSAGTDSVNSGSSSSSGTASTKASAAIEKIIDAGQKYLGTPYEYGSNRNTTTTFDCSDLMKQIFKEGAGVTLPADSRQQGAYVKAKGNYTTDISKLKRGDLMFFMSYKGSSASAYSGINKQSQTITHVALYLGNGKVLHTYSNESGGVRTSDINNTHWEYRFIFGGSAL